MFLLRIIKEREFEFLEEITDKYPNAIPVNTFSKYEDIYEINVKNTIDRPEPKVGQLIRFIDRQYRERCYVVLETTVDNGVNNGKPGLYGFGGYVVWKKSMEQRFLWENC